MLHEKNEPSVIVVMPAYNAEQTLRQTVEQLPRIAAETILCDDGSKDQTTALSRSLHITTVRHSDNRGYGANQKTLYRLALERRADIVVMVHPDNQYETKDLPRMIDRVWSGDADMVLGTRMATARACGMPWWKYIGNRGLTFVQNMIFGLHLTEYHSGLRIYRASLLEGMPIETFSDDFVFDSQVIAWCVAHGYRIGEHPVKCYYHGAASSVNFWRSVVYGLETLATLMTFCLQKPRK